MYDLIVIGGGSAGLVAAVGAARLSARVLLVERRALGGDCLYTGCVPSKTFIRSARFAAEAMRAADLGFAPTGWRFLDDSFASITRRVARVIETVGEHDAPEVFRAEGIEIIFGTPRFVSPRELLIELRDGGGTQTVKGRRFCISTGSRPFVPPIKGLEEAGFVTNEEVFQLTKLPSRLAVLGGGPIGLELGQSFARFGSRVTIVEQNERLLKKEDEEVSAFVEQLMRGEGLEILTKTKATGARRVDGRKVLTIEHDGETREIEADEILVAAGRRPNTEGLNLEAAGVRYDEKRILTDDYLRTTASHIYAAGDVSGNFPFTHMAAYEGALVVRNALFFWPLTQKADFRVVPWTTFVDPEAAHVGLTEREARERYGERNVTIYRSDFADNDRAQAEGETQGFVKLVCAGRKEKIIGASIVGARAGEIVHEVVLAMRQRLGVTALGGLVHVYPTLSQVTQKAALDAVLARLSTPLVRRVMKNYLAFSRFAGGKK